MTLPQALILGLVQGLTEFLPISSSGHLVIGQNILGFSEPPVSFDILVHIGTLTAVLIFFRQILWRLVKKTASKLIRGEITEVPKETTAVIVGTIPAVIIGFFLNHFIEKIFNSVVLVGVTLMLTAGLLFSTTLIKKSEKKLTDLTWRDALFIGILQALAILPGISRSGSTVVAGLWRNLTRESAFVFSFLLSIPAILGAMVLQVGDTSNVINGDYLTYFMGFVSAVFSGYLSLKLFKNALIQGKLAFFGIYCLLLGIGTLLFLS